MAASPTGDILAFRNRDQLMIWDVATKRVLRRRRIDRQIFTAGAISPDATILATGEDGGEVPLWDVATLEPLGTLRGHLDAVGEVAFSPDGKTLVSASKDGTVKLWDVATFEELLTLPEPFKGVVLHPCFSPDGRTLAVWAGSPGKLGLYLLSTALSEDLTAGEGP